MGIGIPIWGGGAMPEGGPVRGGPAPRKGAAGPEPGEAVGGGAIPGRPVLIDGGGG